MRIHSLTGIATVTKEGAGLSGQSVGLWEKNFQSHAGEFGINRVKTETEQ